jgi:hypothetical protein
MCHCRIVFPVPLDLSGISLRPLKLQRGDADIVYGRLYGCRIWGGHAKLCLKVFGTYLYV